MSDLPPYQLMDSKTSQVSSSWTSSSLASSLASVDGDGKPKLALQRELLNEGKKSPESASNDGNRTVWDTVKDAVHTVTEEAESIKNAANEGISMLEKTVSDWDNKIGITKTVDDVSARLQLKQKMELLSRDLNDRTTALASVANEFTRIVTATWWALHMRVFKAEEPKMPTETATPRPITVGN